MTLARLRARLGNPLEWSYADKALLLIGLYLLVNITFLLVQLLVLRYPGLVPSWANPASARGFLAVQSAFVGWWILLLPIALIFRKKRPESRLLAYATALACVTHDAWFMAWAGYATNPLTLLLLFGHAFFGLLVFDTTLMILAIGVWIGILGAHIAGEAMGWLRYAPGLSASPFGGGSVSPSWVAWTMGAGGLITALVLSMYGYIIHRWREREAQIKAANALIRRYVPAQLADRILAGEHREGDRHERRNLTVFFSDIQGFTETADRLESERLSELLNEYLTEMSAIAADHGGTIDKFVGDAIMIFFGAPEATDDRDHALRAVRMAMAMQARMRDLNRAWYESGIQTPFRIRIGINTGTATVGNFGSAARMDYTAIGNQVNLAARLESRCEPGGILISHSTWGLVHDAIPCTEKGEIEVKGLHYPVKVYAVELER